MRNVLAYLWMWMWLVTAVSLGRADELDDTHNTPAMEAVFTSLIALLGFFWPALWLRRYYDLRKDTP